MMSESTQIQTEKENLPEKETASSFEPRKIASEIFQNIVIEDISPSSLATASLPSAMTASLQIEGGSFPIKWMVGRPFCVECTAFRDGSQTIQASLIYRETGKPFWQESPMTFLQNDWWRGIFTPQKNTRYEYTIEAWTDPVASWQSRTEQKCREGFESDGEFITGIKLIEQAAKALKPRDRAQLHYWAKQLRFSESVGEEVLRIIQSESFRQLTRRLLLKTQVTRYPKIFELVVDRKRAEYGAWYELFPRSQGKQKKKSGTFDDCLKRLPDIKKMGFNVIYFPPIHPIGLTNRKGPNNTLPGSEKFPGSPWAVGSAKGGHKSIHPSLGTLEDFERFVHAASDYGIEIALDFAAQCSPDHPYVREHPDWFHRLADGSIRQGENPPHRYQDVYPLNFYCADRKALWQELRSVLIFWIERGVKLFRVDSPHLKPLRFWQWLIHEIQTEHPDVIFLAGAFTRPKVMKFLSKIGFTQSYTYFPWRNQKWELLDYVNELLHTDMRYYFRGNFFVNTHDILPKNLQHTGRNAFKIRALLAATLSATYGIYSGFELCENVPLQNGSEEYLDSEKYEIKTRNWNQSGNIKEWIGQINRIRNENPALQQNHNFQFFETHHDQLIAYGKWNDERSNVLVTVVNLDPNASCEGLLTIPINRFGIEPWQTFQMIDLLTGDKYDWKGYDHYIHLDPDNKPAHLFLLKV